MEDAKFYEQRILALLHATPRELCARLKQRLNQSLIREGYPILNVRDYGCRKFVEFLKKHLGDHVELTWPTSAGDVTVSLKSVVAPGFASNPSPSEQLSNIRTDVWQAFTNPDAKRKRFLNKIDFRIIHFIEGSSDAYAAKWQSSQQDYIEIDVLTGDVQIGWMREFIALLGDGELDLQVVEKLLSSPYSTGVNTGFTKLLGGRADEWRKIRMLKIGEHIASWATQNNINMNDLRPKTKRKLVAPEAGLNSVSPPLLTIREQAIKLLERMSEDEIARVAIPVLLGSVLSHSQL